MMNMNYRTIGKRERINRGLFYKIAGDALSAIILVSIYKSEEEGDKFKKLILEFFQKVDYCADIKKDPTNDKFLVIEVVYFNFISKLLQFTVKDYYYCTLKFAISKLYKEFIEIIRQVRYHKKYKKRIINTFRFFNVILKTIVDIELHNLIMEGYPIDKRVVATIVTLDRELMM